LGIKEAIFCLQFTGLMAAKRKLKISIRSIPEESYLIVSLAFSDKFFYSFL
jgi:hypothetical protein